MVVAETIRGRTRLAEFKGAWDRLMEQGDHEPSVSFEWTAALMESHVEEHDDIVFIVLKRLGVVIGIIPLVIRPMKKLGQTLMRAFPVSEFTNTHSDLLLEDSSEPVVRAFVDALYRSDLHWDVFSMTRLLEAQPLGMRLCEVVRQQGNEFELRREQPSFFLTLDSTLEGYLQRRSGSFRNALKRIERKLRGQGGIESRDQSNFPDIDQAYEALLSIEERSWKHSHGTSISDVARQTTFYRQLCRLSSQKKWLHLSFLYLDGRPIAYNLGLILRDTYYYLKTSYDYALRPLSPATLLRRNLLEDLIARGVTRFDFPGEPYEWERQWTDEMRWHRSLTLFAPSAKGFAYSLYRKAIHFKRSDDALQIKYVNPRDLKPGP
jgi:CelD/BcsL family acetyltransferase involved in cellulose biosynthesis